MHEKLNERTEQLDRVISALVDQIEWLSKRSKLFDINDKTSNSQKHTEWVLEASTLMLQLSRSVNELLSTKDMINNQDIQDAQGGLYNALVGRK